VPIFHDAFGKDEEICKKASPINHVKGKHPPFLIAYADTDFPMCDKMSDQLCSKLKESKCEAVTVKVPDRNHFTIMLNLVKSEKDPCTQAMFEFIGKHSDWTPIKK
jgi:dipeptidyl aminopeptidase/acylaminoacyl peptidase